MNPLPVQPDPSDLSENALNASALPAHWFFRKHDDFAHLCLIETRFKSEMLKPMGDCLARIKAEGMRKVLLEEDIQHFSVTTPHVLATLEALRAYDGFDLKVALLTYRPERLGDLRFIETVAVNRGYEVQAFADVGLALEWLLSAA